MIICFGFGCLHLRGFHIGLLLVRAVPCFSLGRLVCKMLTWLHQSEAHIQVWNPECGKDEVMAGIYLHQSIP